MSYHHERGVRTVRIIIHYPETIETQSELSQKAAAVHAQTVMEKIRSLSCPIKQKAELIDAIRQIHQNGDGT